MNFDGHPREVTKPYIDVRSYPPLPKLDLSKGVSTRVTPAANAPTLPVLPPDVRGPTVRPPPPAMPKPQGSSNSSSGGGSGGNIRGPTARRNGTTRGSVTSPAATTSRGSPLDRRPRPNLK